LICYATVLCVKTIFLFAWPRIFASDLLRGEYIAYLAKQYRVIVFIREEDPSLFQSENITYIPFELQAGKFWTIFNTYLRTYLIRRFDHLEGVQFRYARYKGEDRFKNILRFIAHLFPRTFFSPRFFMWLENMCVPNTAIFKKYVEMYKPDLVVTTTPGFNFMEAWAILCAKKAGIPTVATNFSWDNLTTLPRFLRKTDYILCWNEILKKEAIELHEYKAENVFVSGIMRYDDYFKKLDGEVSREEFLNSKGLNPSKKTILVATSTDPDEDLYKKIIRKLRDTFNENIIVRVHPIERLSQYEEFVGLPNICVEHAGTVKQSDTEKGWQIEMEEKDRVNTKMILKYCDLNINRSSTITLDSLIFDMPAINLDFGTSPVPIVTFPHYRPLIAEGAVRLAKNMDEVLEFTKTYLENPSRDSENRKKIVTSTVGFLDGLSYKRAADFLGILLR